MAVWAFAYFLGSLVWVGSELLGYDLPARTTSGGVIFGVFVAFAALAGLLWLIGEGVAGFRISASGRTVRRSDPFRLALP
ncbi:hypothetical protein GEV29_15115 [Aeromicrobium sp. SMF47]|uniref:hypothetical protein n=1 Tax=Aeromicrobium yanjiei TaxID=2662028 RepID=UPI00129E0900|nr:hypothetical protein [Aeromicrobium yanjiei]MRJ77871.1 hypothetical protein [Aeromicrobium yanjiei]